MENADLQAEASLLEALNSNEIISLRQKFGINTLKGQRVYFISNPQLPITIQANGKTFTDIPLVHYSILNQRSDLFYFFLSQYFDVESKCNGWSPLQLAVFLNQLDFVDMLIFYHAKIDDTNDIFIFFFMMFN